MQEDNMKSFTISAALLAGFGALVFMGTAGSTVPASAKCMFDEGYGRYTPCSAMYKSKKCFIDEGNGRRTPCSALVKNSKKKGYAPVGCIDRSVDRENGGARGRRAPV
jgi:hypothetical protein